MNLRDHDQPCEHPHVFENGSQTDGWLTSHQVVGSNGQPVGSIVCPGGAAVVIDYEAACVVINGDGEDGMWGLSEIASSRIRQAVDAALGDGE